MMEFEDFGIPNTKPSFPELADLSLFLLSSLLQFPTFSWMESCGLFFFLV
jgi:hypothetical protein